MLQPDFPFSIHDSCILYNPSYTYTLPVGLAKSLRPRITLTSLDLCKLFSRARLPLTSC
ncbi:hypothetical protein HanIR_Chr10g0469541 [Helianthus annuus]|nr:hypothetical protein HanIR_Chr10g0469541 [Helianthus annuus]